MHCPGCCNKELQELKPNYIVSLEELVGIIKEAKERFDIEGVTLSGGEPSLQKGLLQLNQEIKRLGLGIIMFSGKQKDVLDKGLVSSVDLLIDGPFVQELLDEQRVLIGSKNKRLCFITERYRPCAQYFDNPVAIEEVALSEDGYIFVNGD